MTEYELKYLIDRLQEDMLLMGDVEYSLASDLLSSALAYYENLLAVRCG